MNDEKDHLNPWLEEMLKSQLTFLDEAGKRVIELSTGMLGVLFAVIAFGKDFPPSYLKDNPWTQGVGIGVLVALVFALLAGVITVQPKIYKKNDQNALFNKIKKHKFVWMQIATWAFFAGTLLLAILIGILILSS